MPAKSPPEQRGEARRRVPLPDRELIIVAADSARLRAAGTRVQSLSGAPVEELNKLLSDENVQLLPLFGSERRFEAARASLAAAGVMVPDLTGFYTVKVEDAKMEALAAKLAKAPGIAGAYVKPAAEMASVPAAAEVTLTEAPPVTPDFTSRQGYLRAAPGGVDADFAATQAGGGGAGGNIIDVEGAWNFSHEDLLQNQGGVIGGTPTTDMDWKNHGTAVAGEFGADRNGIGVTGIAPDAQMRAISIFGGMGTAPAITQAANALSAGDIILIELHRAGPRFDYEGRDDQRGYIAIEWWPDDLAAVQYAVGKGVIVVEAAGNGAENLDDALYDTPAAGFPATWRNPFNTANPASGAVLAGAGAPPPGTHGRDHGPDRSRLDFSNFGARLDAQGWGREVTTTGYGDLQGGGENLQYTDTFSGTSSASPIVVGSIACIQGMLAAMGKAKMTPAKARETLRTTGSVQQDAPGRPATQRIGNRPDIKAAINWLTLSTVQSGVATQYWNELVAYPPGSAASLWLYVDNDWKKHDTVSSAYRELVQQAFLRTGSRVRVWYQGTDIVGLVVEGS